MIKTIIKNGQTFAKLSDINPWDKNPKEATPADLGRLEKMLELGDLGPMLVVEDTGVAIGGVDAGRRIRDRACMFYDGARPPILRRYP